MYVGSGIILAAVPIVYVWAVPDVAVAKLVITQSVTVAVMACVADFVQEFVFVVPVKVHVTVAV